MSWQPSASINNLRERAQILKKIRGFFASRDVLEVETPLLCSTSVTAPHILSIPAFLHSDKSKIHYLQTSPEYAMKRLLAAGSGSIYQITKAFRLDEKGLLHNPEFTMLEWYRLNFNHHDLMDEMDELLQLVLNTKAAERKSYAEIFSDYLNINPHSVSVAELKKIAEQNNIQVVASITDRDTWLQLLLSHYIEPQLGKDAPCFIYDFPASQAALARLQPDNPDVASRFEVYVKGIELANGFHELQNAGEQRKRFENDRIERKTLNQPDMPIDELFLSALTHGLPDCSGVALGLDRLAMLATGSSKIEDVLSFDFERI